MYSPPTQPELIRAVRVLVARLFETPDWPLGFLMYVDLSRFKFAKAFERVLFSFPVRISAKSSPNPSAPFDPLSMLCTVYAVAIFLWL